MTDGSFQLFHFLWDANELDQYLTTGKQGARKQAKIVVSCPTGNIILANSLTDGNHNQKGQNEKNPNSRDWMPKMPHIDG